MVVVVFFILFCVCVWSGGDNIPAYCIYLETKQKNKVDKLFHQPVIQIGLSTV